MNVLSLFSGVGGFDLGLERAGMTTVAQCEWDAKCQQVLARHWPDVPRWGDVADVRGADLPDCDVVAFGSPCQDLSVAGKRAGMVEGETRSGLFYEAIRIIKELQDEQRGPAWVVWENVVGALSSNSGHDFAAVLDSLGELGAVDIQWRVLDAQWFGVPQRRRRVFVVARLDPRAAGGPAVLPVGASVRRDSPSGSEARPVVAALTANGVGGGGGPDDNAGQAGHLIAARESGFGRWKQDDLAGPLRAEQGGIPSQGVASPLTDTDRMTFVPQITGMVNMPTVEVVGAFTQGAHPGGFNGQDAYTGHAVVVAVAENQRGELRLSEVSPSVTDGGAKPGQGYPAVLAFDSTFGGQSNVFEDMTPPVKVGSGAGIASPPAVAYDEYNNTVSEVHQCLRVGSNSTGALTSTSGSLAVRRLTPRECERLMGWPDDWTRYTADGTEVADSHRYRMCGNGVASPVAEWVGRCILEAAA